MRARVTRRTFPPAARRALQPAARRALQPAPRRTFPPVPRLPRKRSAHRTVAGVIAVGVLALLCGCGATHPPQLPGGALAEAQTFPYFKLYWVGPSFAHHPLTAVDGRNSYSTAIGDSVYYGDCVTNKGLLGGGGSCALPLQVTTVIYRLHSNGPLGPQRNALIRGVPATIYDEGRSIELYSGQLAIDVFSDTLADALVAVNQLKPINTPGSTSGGLAPPVFCPGLSGPIPADLGRAMSDLPGHPCQRAQAAIEAVKRLAGATSSR